MGRGGVIPDRLGSPLLSCGVSASLSFFSLSPSVFFGRALEDLRFAFEPAFDLALGRPVIGGLN